MNDLAFKAINNTSLKNMVDKRALVNKDLYEKMETEALDITKNMNFEKLAETNK